MYQTLHHHQIDCDVLLSPSPYYNANVRILVFYLEVNLCLQDQMGLPILHLPTLEYLLNANCPFWNTYDCVHNTVAAYHHS